MKKFLIVMAVVAMGGIFYLASSNSQPEVASANTVSPTDTPIPTPTVNPYKAPLQQHLAQAESELQYYQDDYTTTNNNLTSYKQKIQEPSTQSIYPTGIEGEVEVNLIPEILNIETQNITSMNNRLASDANKIDQLREEQGQLEYELSQM